ncbi:MAG: peptide ligase PGM1-related protein [Vicinamibacterales bacterium]
MIPKPPFPCDLTLDEELARFAKLQDRLKDVWDGVIGREATASTSVVVPSFTLDQDELRKLDGVAFYEERLLFLLIRLRNPRAHVVYVTSQPVHPIILDYYLHLLAGVPASHARARLTMLCAYDSSPRPLTQKILERPRLIERIRRAIQNPSCAFLTVFNSTPLERQLAVLLGIPLNGLDPQLKYLGTKSGNRKVFREAGIELPAGREDLQSESDVVDALVDLKAERPDMRRAVVKLNESFSGEGNAVFRYPPVVERDTVQGALADLEFAVSSESRDHYFGKFAEMGGIVEEFIDAKEKISPSAQFRTSPFGDVSLVSTHDQILGGPSGQVYLGCSFPAQDDYRLRLQDAGRRIGEVLAQHGVVSRFGVDFLAWRDNHDDPWRVTALEINLRVVGTTHPFLALRFLTGGDLDAATGLFLSLSGRSKHYRATDNLRSERYRGLLPEDLIDIVTDNGLHYSHRTESGVLFHLIGALSEFGKLGVTVIANSRDEVDALYAQTLEILDAETVYGHPEASASPRASSPAR